MTSNPNALKIQRRQFLRAAGSVGVAQCVAGGAFYAAAAGPVGYPVRHPVFRRAVDARQVPKLAVETAKVLAFSREEIDRWIVARSSFEMIACPNCQWPGGRRDRKNYWRWSADQPERIECIHCGMTYPDGRYPLTAVDRVADPTGKMQEFAYFPGEDGYRFYLEGKIDNARKQYMERAVPLLADLYAATKESRYARQAAQILDRLAEVYPHYNVQICRRAGSPVLLDHPILESADGVVPVPAYGAGRAGQDQGTTYPYWSNRRGDGWNGWFYSEMPTELAYAYDTVAVSDELERLGEELGRDVRANVRRYFRDTANYCRSYPVYLGNMDPTLVRGFAVIGRVIGEPQFVHDAVRRVEMILQRQFFPDGNWREAAPSYHSQTIGGLRSAVAGPLGGYSDPPGYMPSEGRQRIENLDLGRQLPFLGESAAALEAMKLPNGSHACIHDTWSPTTRGRRLANPSTGSMPSHLHWGMGHAVLGAGRQDSGLQAHLHFSGGYGHTHADTLNLILFGKSRELVSDIGYTHSILRPYAVGSLSHNLVVVDERDQRLSGTEPPADGCLIVSARLGDGVQYVEAGGEGAYPERVDLYRRALAVVATPAGEAYAVDIFRVSGGSQHDWLLHGSADEDMDSTTTLALQPFEGSLLPEGVEFRGWTSEYGSNVIGGVNHSYGLFRNLQRAPGEHDWSAEWNCRGGPALRTTLLGQPGTEVFAGELPSIRRAQEDSGRVYDHWMPAVMARRQGENLRSVFLAVHQACEADTERYLAARLPVRSDDPFAVGVVVRGDGFTDYHLAGSSHDSVLRTLDPAIAARGRYALLRVTDGTAPGMAVLDGTLLEVEGRRLEAPASALGEVLAVRDADAGDEEHALVVSGKLLARSALPEERVVVRFGDGMTYGLAVREIRSEGDATVIALAHRPGFRIASDGKKTIRSHHPSRESADRPTYHLPGAAWRGV